MKKTVCSLLCLCLLLACVPSLALIESDNPLIDPKKITSYTATENEYYNILILGVDLAYDGYGTSGSSGAVKNDNFAGCHTDAVMLLSIDLTNSKLRLLSLPRDTFSYVPGERGIYKLNAAFNCADNIYDGFMRTCETVSWLCGCIRIDAYACLDIEAMIALGDEMGGVDFDLDMSYVGSEHRHYKKGQQHLDGRGMMDYMRARRNATVNMTDVGRTGRQRRMITAIFQKLKKKPDLMLSLWQLAMSGDINFYTNIDEDGYAQLYQLFEKLDSAVVENYVLDASLLSAMDGWNMNFTKQENRQEVLKTLFGIDAEPLKYVSYKYTKWLMDGGLLSVKVINLSKLIIQKANKMQLNDAQKAAVQALDAQYDITVTAFDQAANTLEDKDIREARNQRNTLREMAQAVAAQIGYGENFNWKMQEFWYRDPSVNAWNEIDWR